MTRADAKQRALETWSGWHWTTRVSAIIGIILGALALMGFMRTGAEWWLLPRREHEHFRDSVVTAAQLHAVRDSARQETVVRALKYNACLTRTRGKDGPCAHLTTP
jgi:hypothetical protein